MNLKNKPALQTILIALLFFITLLIWTLWQFHFNYMVSMYDTYFHSQRIYEIRLAFQQHTLPSWVNFNTFFNTGQAINGMYPDFTLWPFVWITNFLTPIHQQIAIKVLIYALTFIVSFLSLNKRFDSRNAVLAASIFALSGSALKDLTNEMQTGTAIVMIFAFPLLFTLKDAVESTKIDPPLIIKTALLMTIVINSHLLSAVTITIIVGIFLIIETILKKNYLAWINLAIAALLTVALCLPIIYRVLRISKTGLLAPFGKGHVISEPIWTLFMTTSWNAKSTISVASIILLVIVLIGIKKEKLCQLMPWFLVELVLIIFSTNLVPWGLLSKLPVLDTFQYANWRFAPFLGMVPLVLILINFDQKKARLIFVAMTALSYGMAIYTAYHDQFYKTANSPIITEYSKTIVPMNNSAKLTSTGINSDMLMRTLIPDYAPNSVPLQKDSDGASLDPQVNYLISHHLAVTPTKDIPLTHTTTANSLTLTAHNVPKGTIKLPVFGYRTLNYQVLINGKKVPFKIDETGFITLTNQDNYKKVDYHITQIQPTLYRPLIWFSFILFGILIIMLSIPKIQNIRQ
ncbi:hypothetical protein JMJ99_09380 [Companilactobacillus zhachilii]|uniref:hypothetical protein n=1 Tax=Companilactobacillus zhachilii TaxID=2304606 RepID=UPI001921A3AD|nr:hypothetical protein [Companilactobacillus zhachilii]MBL3531577.1 hypothetical protein [Companilactobacillus zhachilii]